MQAEKHLKITKHVHIGDVFRAQSNIYDGAFLQNQSTFLAVDYFRRKAPS